MKFWNKSPQKRKTWTRVETSRFMSEEKRWCQQHHSTGKFFCNIRHVPEKKIQYDVRTIWLFERPEDASAFTVQWVWK